MSAPTEAERKETALGEYRKKLLKHKEVDTKVRSLREAVKELKKEYDKTEDDLKALQSVGQIIGEVLRQLDEERCERCARAPAPRTRASSRICSGAGRMHARAVCCQLLSSIGRSVRALGCAICRAVQLGTRSRSRPRVCLQAV